jgi:hypothetical protein
MGDGFVMLLFKLMLLPLFLLAKDIDCVLELYKSCSFFIDVLHSGFGTLSHCLPSSDSFLLLTKPFNLLLNSS